MKTIKVYHYDAFSHVPNMGNPAGVVFNGEELSDQEMQAVAKKVGFTETAFPMKSDQADIRIRYFTPGHEVDLCGHATIATMYALKTKGLLGDKTDLKIETKEGILQIKLNSSVEDELLITMQQAFPKFKEFNGSLKEIADAIGIEESDIETKLPTLYGSTGTWTLLVPIKSLNTFKKMRPNNAFFPNILKEMPRVSIHPFCLETYDSSAHMHGRHFSSAFSGTIEDPITGNASGVMGAYYAKYINKNVDLMNLIVEQGQEIGRNGKVGVTLSKRDDDQYDIEITGNAVYNKDFNVFI